MVVLNEKDADRIASYLRKRLEEVENENDFAEKMMENYHRKMLNSSGEDSDVDKFLLMLKNMVLMGNKARKAEIAELIALLMTGSEK